MVEKVEKNDQRPIFTPAEFSQQLKHKKRAKVKVWKLPQIK